MQADIPRLPELLEQFPDAKWRQLKLNLACVWPRVMWLNADNEAPGIQQSEQQQSADATAALGDEAQLRGYDAWESLMEAMHRRHERRQGREPAPYDWRAPSSACKRVVAATHAKALAAP